MSTGAVCRQGGSTAEEGSKTVTRQAPNSAGDVARLLRLPVIKPTQRTLGGLDTRSSPAH